MQSIIVLMGVAVVLPFLVRIITGKDFAAVLTFFVILAVMLPHSTVSYMFNVLSSVLH